MFFKIALRNLVSRKVYALINIFGLGIGLAACLTIYLYVKDELSYDKFYPHSERIYRIVRESGQGGEKSSNAATNYKLGELAKEYISDIEQLTQFSMPIEAKVKLGENTYLEDKVHWADQNFLKVFGITFEGSIPEPLATPLKVVISKKIKDKLFGDKKALGELLTIDDRQYEITAIAEGLSSKAHFHFDYLLSLETTKKVYAQDMFDHWGNVWLYNYALLKEDIDIGEFEKQINSMAFEHGPSEALNQYGIRFFSQSIEDIHLHSNLQGELEQNGNYQLLTILIAVAVLILTIACFNFINLSTARSMWRAKEVGVKKVLGVNKLTLVRQFLGESLLITFISLILAVFIISITLPFFNTFTGKSIGVTDIIISLPALAGIVILVGIIAGSFPAFFLSSFDPIKTLKGQSSQGNSKVATSLRQLLVVIQFAIAIVLIVGAVIIYQQLNYIKSKDLGADIEGVVVIKLNNKATRDTRVLMENTLSQLSTVKSVSAASDLPFDELNSWRAKPSNIDVEQELINIIAVDDNYLKSLNMQWVAGGVDKLDSNSMIVNEAFVRHYLMANPVGSEIEIDHMKTPLRIVGVVKDFHFESLHTAIRPVMLYNLPSWYQKLAIRISTTDLDKTMTDIGNAWKSVNPDDELNHEFLADKFSRMYQSEEQTAKMVTYFSIFSIFIACMGLYGLAAFLAETKLKEISIRKVLGATVNQMLTIQMKVFVKLMIIAAIIGIPMAYLLVDDWLSGFVYRVEVQEWVMILAFGIIVLFTIVSVGYSSFRAAITNPSDNLRMD